MSDELWRSSKTRLDWLALWDRLHEEIQTGQTSWGRNQLLAKMDEMERKAVRELEASQHEEGT